MTQPSRLDDSERPPDPMIPGIYNYCDRWCERCMFSARCRVFRDRRLMDDATERGEDPAAILSGVMQAECEEADRDRTPGERAEWDAFLQHANVLPTERELADVSAWLERRDGWINTQPVTRISREYTRVAMDVCLPLKEMLAPADEVARTAVETVLHLAALIPAKVFRALTGLPDTAGRDDDWDLAGMEDANGSAKVVRLAVAESRAAWAVLRDLPVLDVMPAAMMRQLNEIEAEMARLFPGSLSFVRPGYDDGGVGSWE